MVEEGTRVLVFNYVDINNIRKAKNQFVLGTVTKVFEQANSYDGYACNIVDDEGNDYTAFHRYPNDKYGYYFRTIDEHIFTLKEYIESNNDSIKKLLEDNEIINSTLETLESLNSKKTL